MSRRGNGNVVAADFIKDLELEALPEEVIEHAKRCHLDNLGSTLGGSKTRGAEILTDFVAGEGGSKKCTIINSGEKVSCTRAALANGFMANALDIDDGYRPLKGHPGAAIFPAILAVAEREGVDGKEYLEALIVGYEIAIRAGLILHSAYNTYHGSGSWGSVGAAAGAAKLLDLTKRQIKNALGIAEMYAPITPEFRAVENPSMATKDGIEWGTYIGAVAAILSEKGYTGVPSLLGNKNYTELVLELGRKWRFLDLYFKKYACCRWAQPSIEGTLKTMKKYNLERSKIERILIKTFEEATKLPDENPTSTEEATYNVKYPVAVAILDGEVGPKQLSKERFQDKKLLNFAEKVELQIDEEIDEKFPEKCLADVEIETKGGRKYKSGKTTARGTPENPLTDEELEEKFLNLARYAGVSSPIELMSLAKNIDYIDDITEIIEYIK